MQDPHVPLLQEMRKNLEAEVKKGSVTPAEASAFLGSYAESLAGKRPVARSVKRRLERTERGRSWLPTYE